jgi:hypothetical protein
LDQRRLAIKAAYAHDPERGFALFDEFSRRCTAEHDSHGQINYTPEKTRRDWDSFNPDRITAGSLHYYADEDAPGWRDDYDALVEEALNKAAGAEAEAAFRKEMFGTEAKSGIGHEAHGGTAGPRSADSGSPQDEHETADSGARSTKNPRPVLGADAFHGFAGELVRTIEPHTEADPAAILLQFLVVFGNMVGRKRYYLIESDRHYPNL